MDHGLAASGMETIHPPLGAVSPRPEPPGTEVRRRIRPVQAFAVVGTAGILVQSYVLGRWLASGPVRTDPGPDPIPGWMSASLVVNQVVSVVAGVGAVYYFILRRWRRREPLPLPGIVILACLSTYWLDIAANYFRHIYVFNAHLVNFGAWYHFIPGWQSPHAGRLAEPVLFTLPFWAWGTVLPALGFSALMRRAKARRPHWGTARLIGVSMLAAAVVDSCEIAWGYLGVYQFAGTIPALTIFDGRYYQFPIYQVPIVAGLWTAYSALFSFRDDRGCTIPERGVDDLHLGPRRRTALRFLALSGYSHLAMLTYNLLFALVSLAPGFRWSSDIVHHRSYLRDGLCGAGTALSCPGY